MESVKRSLENNFSERKKLLMLPKFKKEIPRTLLRISLKLFRNGSIKTEEKMEKS